MKQLLIALLTLLSLAAHAQGKRVYWVGTNQISVENSDGSNALMRDASAVQITTDAGSIVVGIGGAVYSLAPSNFLNSTGSAYGGTVDSAYAAFKLTAPGSGGITQAYLTTILQGYYQPVTVVSKAAAIATATGLQPKIITVLTDESDNNRTRNKYIYDGDNQPLGLPLF